MENSLGFAEFFGRRTLFSEIKDLSLSPRFVHKDIHIICVEVGDLFTKSTKNLMFVGEVGCKCLEF